MRLVVIGAAGRLGREVVVEAARRGHHVTGVARSAAALAQVEGLSAPVVGDVREPAVAAAAVSGADAVICTVPGGDRADPHRAADVAGALNAAMHAAAVPRLVVTSAYPIVARRPAPVMALLRRVFATPYADTGEADRLVAGSGLAWTVVRLNRLTDGAPVGRPHVSTGELDRPTGLRRTDAAALLLDVSETHGHVRQSLNVGGTAAAS